MPQTHIPRAWPLLAGALAAASFIGMDTAVKSMAPRYDTLQLTFLRFASGSLFAVALWLWHRTPMPARSGWGLHGLRAVLLLVSLVGYFHALTRLPLAQAVAVSYIAPIGASLLAVRFLGERPSPWIWAALGLGAAGVGVAMWPELSAMRPTDGLEGLLSAGFAALAFSGVMVLARRHAQRDSLWTILLVQNLLPTLLLALPAAFTWHRFDTADLATVALAGALATVGLLSLTWAFSHLEASRVAALEYTSLVWAALLGYAFFGEVPSAHTVVSAVLIVTGCLLLLRR